MTITTNLSTKKAIVSGVQKAMQRSKYNLTQKNTRTNMALAMDKWDCIIEEISKEFENKTDYSTGILNTGIYKALFVYEKITGTLYSLMRETNYKDVLRGNKSATYYLNAALDYNVNLPRKYEQLTYFPQQSSEADEEILNLKKTKIELNLNITEEDVTSYITIIFNEKTFNLQDISAYLTNKYYEIIDTDDWSELITANIDDSENLILKKELATQSKENNGFFAEIDIPIGVKENLENVNEENKEEDINIALLEDEEQK